MVHNPGADWHTGGLVHASNELHSKKQVHQENYGPYDLNMYTTHPGKFDIDAGYDSLEKNKLNIYCYAWFLLTCRCVFSIGHGSFSSHVSWGKQSNSSMGSSLGAPLVSQECRVVPSKNECQPGHIYCHRASNYTR